MKPKSVSIDITDRCQMQCITCSKWQTDSTVLTNELSTEEWKKILLNLQNWLGRFAFIFSGGEPFLRQDIFELIHYARAINTVPIIISNGFGLKDKYQKIIDSPLASFIVSLNALDASLHDETRGRNGCFDNTLETICTLNELRKKHSKPLKLNLSTILMPQNLDEIPKLIEFTKNEGLDGITLQLLEDSASFHAYYKNQSANAVNNGVKFDLNQNNKGIISTIDRVIEMKENGYPIRNSIPQLQSFKLFFENFKEIIKIECNVGTTNFSIDPYGSVRLCYNMQSIGSLAEHLPEELWNSESADKQKNAINNCKKTCRLLNCNFK